MTALQSATYRAVVDLSAEHGVAKLQAIREKVREADPSAGDLSIGAVLFYLKRDGYIIRVGIGQYALKEAADPPLF